MSVCESLVESEQEKDLEIEIRELVKERDNFHFREYKRLWRV